MYHTHTHTYHYVLKNIGTKCFKSLKDKRDPCDVGHKNQERLLGRGSSHLDFKEQVQDGEEADLGARMFVN